jgi:hypothetical protein
MNAKLTSRETTSRYSFELELDGLTYSVVVYLNEKGKFIDDSVVRDEIELEFEGDEGEIRENILTYLDENWDNLVK